MPNIGGPKEAKRRLLASVVHSKLRYAAPVWANALQNHAIRRKLFSAHKSITLRIVSAYRAGDLLAPQGAYLYRPAGIRSRKGGDPQRSRAQTRREMADEQTGRWTYRLISELSTWLNREHGESAFIWRKRFQAMAVLTRT